MLGSRYSVLGSRYSVVDAGYWMAEIHLPPIKGGLRGVFFRWWISAKVSIQHPIHYIPLTPFAKGEQISSIQIVYRAPSTEHRVARNSGEHPEKLLYWPWCR